MPPVSSIGTIQSINQNSYPVKWRNVWFGGMPRKLSARQSAASAVTGYSLYLKVISVISAYGDQLSSNLCLVE